MAFIDKKTQDLLDYMNEESHQIPTVYDCDGCKYNIGLIKGEHCRGCKVPYGNNWGYRQKPTNYEEQIVTFTINSGENEVHHD